MISPTGILPENLMYPAKLGDVMEFIKAMPMPGHYKEQLFLGWSRTVGVKLRGSQIDAVRNTGTDRRGTQ